MLKDRLKFIICTFLAAVLSITGFFCLFWRVKSGDNIKNDLAFAAAALMMPEFAEDRENYEEETDRSKPDVGNVSVDEATRDEEEKPEEPVDLHEDEVHYPVVETLYGESGVSCDNFYIKDTADVTVDFEELLKLPLGFDFVDDDSVQVLIYHTHTTESYLEYDEGYYHESFYPRSDDEDKNMVRVGKALAESLEKQGIGAVHAREIHDSPEYTGAYYRSWDTAEKYMEKYPGIKVVLDIHRDSVSTGVDNGKIKPTFEVNGRKAAQIMIVAGCDPYGTEDFPDWEYNLRFALKLQRCAEEMYPGMTRPMYFGNFSYNLALTTGSLLIEVGTDVNSIDEAEYTGELLGNVISKVLQSE